MLQRGLIGVAVEQGNHWLGRALENERALDLTIAGRQVSGGAGRLLPRAVRRVAQESHERLDAARLGNDALILLRDRTGEAPQSVPPHLLLVAEEQTHEGELRDERAHAAGLDDVAPRHATWLDRHGRPGPRCAARAVLYWAWAK